MKLIKIIIVIGTFALIGIIMGGHDVDIDDLPAFDAFGRSVFAIIVIIIAIALWKAADKEQQRWKK